MKPIKVSSDITLSLDDNAPPFFSESIIVDDSYDTISININDWQAFKDAGDKLIAENKGV